MSGIWAETLESAPIVTAPKLSPTVTGALTYHVAADTPAQLPKNKEINFKLKPNHLMGL